MDIQSELADFKGRLDIELRSYLDRVIDETEARDVFMAEALRAVRHLALSGGKRLRAAFMYQGYLAAGGEDTTRMLRTAVSIELIHLFLLIHDDIIDRDEIRHGVPSMQAHFRAIGQEMTGGVDGIHFGDSMAIIIGDTVGALGNQVIFESGFDPALVLRALAALQEIVSLTVVGQAKDILIEYRGKATEEEILSMYEHKTARYTTDGPLRLGALLAGAPASFGEDLSRYAIPLGIAFQIQDDILGVFGDEDRIGKPIGSDIAEGKITLLVSRAIALASSTEKRELRRILGKGESIEKDDIFRFREILVSTGALASSRESAIGYIRRGIDALHTIEMPLASQNFFEGVAHYMLKRDV